MNDSTIALPDPEKPGGGLSRTARFCQRMDAELAAMPLEARPAWLSRQLAVWLRRYEDWAYLVDKGSDIGGHCDDYLDTISAIGRRLREYGDEQI